MMLGRLMERSDILIEEVRETRGEVGQIHARLADGHRTMTDHSGRIKQLEQDRSPAPPSATAQTIGAVEKLTKSWMTWLIPLGVAWATGSLELAAKVAGLLK